MGLLRHGRQPTYWWYQEIKHQNSINSIINYKSHHKINTIQIKTSPTPGEEQTQSTGANKPEIPSERSEIAVEPQSTKTINLDEKVLEMNLDILRKWEVVKKQAMAERPNLNSLLKRLLWSQGNHYYQLSSY